jgi:hypothetical protein
MHETVCSAVILVPGKHGGSIWCPEAKRVTCSFSQHGSKVLEAGTPAQVLLHLFTGLSKCPIIFHMNHVYSICVSFLALKLVNAHVKS